MPRRMEEELLQSCSDVVGKRGQRPQPHERDLVVLVKYKKVVHRPSMRTISSNILESSISHHSMVSLSDFIPPKHL